jgi:hypothetical protein
MGKRAAGFMFGLLLVAVSTAAWSGDGWTARGRTVRWNMQVPGEWIGGSADQIEEVRGTIQGESLRRLLQEMWYAARQMDAYFVNTDTRGTKARTLTSIEVNLNPKGFAPETFTEETWRALADLDQRRGGASAATQLVESREIVVGGHRAFCGLFRTTTVADGRFYSEMCFVLLGAERTHTFKFKCDEAEWPAHRQQFLAMLASLRYR